MTTYPCEWDPDHDGPALIIVSRFHGDALWSVGACGQWHLCDACAQLPRFRRYRVRRLLGREETERD